jgi:subtilisin family serine protease
MPERDEHGRFIPKDGDNVSDEELTQEPGSDEPQNEDTAPDRDQWHGDEGRDDEGNLIDPPTIPSYERELQEASATGDNDAVAAVQDRYNEGREDHVRALRERQNARGDDE